MWWKNSRVLNTFGPLQYNGRDHLRWPLNQTSNRMKPVYVFMPRSLGKIYPLHREPLQTVSNWEDKGPLQKDPSYRIVRTTYRDSSLFIRYTPDQTLLKIQPTPRLRFGKWNVSLTIVTLCPWSNRSELQKSEYTESDRHFDHSWITLRAQMNQESSLG